MIIAWIHSSYKGIKVTQFHSEIKASKSIETSQNYFCSIIHFYDIHLYAQYFPNTYTVAKFLLNYKAKYGFKQLSSTVVYLTILFAFFNIHFRSWIKVLLLIISNLLAEPNSKATVKITLYLPIELHDS